MRNFIDRSYFFCEKLKLANLQDSLWILFLPPEKENIFK